MNNKRSLFAFLLTILMATSVYADKLQCPAIANVRAATFNQAYEWGEEWLAFSNPISGVDGASWTVFGSVRKKFAADSEAALTYANNTIKTIGMVYPKPVERGDSNECWYANNATFVVIAADKILIPNQFKLAK